MNKLRIVFAIAFFATWGLSTSLSSAQDLVYEAAGGECLTIRAKAEQQQWRVVGDKIFVAAVRDGKLVVQEFPWPAPSPGPKPPDPQPLPSSWQVAFLVESDSLDNLSPAQQSMLASVLIRDELTKQGHKLVGVLDPDSASTASDSVKPWFDSAQGKQLPLVAIAPMDGGTIYTFPLPANSEALWVLLKSPPIKSGDNLPTPKKEQPPADRVRRLLCPGGVCP